MTITEFLKESVPFLHGLTNDQAAYLAQKVEQKSFKKGQTIIFKGVSVEGLHVVAQGTATVWAKPEKGKPAIQVAELKAGDVFGETSILEFCMAGATIKCAQDDTLILIIYQAPFLKLLEADQGLARRTRELIAARKAAQGQPKQAENPEPPQPAPQAAPQPVPQAVPQPAAQSVPQPAPAVKPAE